MVWWTGCLSADPRDVDGALAKAVEAVADGDRRELYTVIDERARHALISIVHDRRASAALVRRHYPEGETAQVLASLGDAARAKDAAALFAMRCDADCLAGYRSTLGAPVESREEGRLVHVKTTRGANVTLYLGSDTWYGLVWHTEALARERDRAAAERELIEKNAALYEKRRELGAL